MYFAAPLSRALCQASRLMRAYSCCPNANPQWLRALGLWLRPPTPIVSTGPTQNVVFYPIFCVDHGSRYISLHFSMRQTRLARFSHSNWIINRGCLHLRCACAVRPTWPARQSKGRWWWLLPAAWPAVPQPPATGTRHRGGHIDSHKHPNGNVAILTNFSSPVVAVSCKCCRWRQLRQNDISISVRQQTTQSHLFITRTPFYNTDIFFPPT